MSADNEKSGHVEQTPVQPDDAKDDAKGIGRFARYTAPAMLAMLASGGQNMAFAQASIPR